MTTKNAYWRTEHGSAAKATALLRLPANLVDLIRTRKPARQSMTSFINDALLRGLGEEPLTWRLPMDWETPAPDPIVLSLDECGVIESVTPEVLTSLTVFDTEDIEW